MTRGAGRLPRLMLIAEPGHDALLGRLRGALALLPAGAALVQLRGRHVEGRALLAEAEALRALTAELGVQLVVSDRVDVALAAGADGVQLPEHGLPVAAARAILGEAAIVGRSIHDPVGAREAAAAGADYLVAAPVFDVPGKGPPLGVAGLRAICQATDLPTFALGGITPERARGCLEAGAHGVARLRGWEGHLAELASLLSRG